MGKRIKFEKVHNPLCVFSSHFASPASGCTTYVVHGSAGNNEGVQKRGTGKNADLVQGSDYAAQGFLEFELEWYFGI